MGGKRISRDVNYKGTSMSMRKKIMLRSQDMRAKNFDLYNTKFQNYSLIKNANNL